MKWWPDALARARAIAAAATWDDLHGDLRELDEHIERLRNLIGDDDE